MSAISPSEIAIPAVVVYELEIGVRQSNNPLRPRLQLDQLLSAVRVLPFDIGCAMRSAASSRDFSNPQHF